ncbi:MAG TPA: penicillin acylase family protein, partial [Candidatus Hypogeohydataceae bacterium YC38]
ASGMICATKGVYGLPKKLGSYAVLVSPKRSTSSKALLLGCPQMGLEGPQPGYEVDLHGGGFDVAGMTFPGVPAVLIGYNQNVAWTLTSGCSDNVDVFVEELNPENPLEYRYLGQWLRLETREEVFHVKGSSPVRERFYRSLHGPIFRMEGGRAYSHKRTFWLEELKAIEAFLQINRAKYMEDFYRAIELIPLSFNLFYAGVEGQIGYWHLGKYRLLAPGSDPRLPLSGTGLEEWRGFVPMDWLPHVINPPEGYMANWNNKPARAWDNGDNLPWVGDHRVRKILSVLEGKKKIGLEDLQGLPKEINSHGTYEQMVELGTSSFTVVNILPPGESGFVGKAEVALWAIPTPRTRKGSLSSGCTSQPIFLVAMVIAMMMASWIGRRQRGVQTPSKGIEPITVGLSKYFF